MIDLHSHILPGMDDGSKSPEMSRTLLSQLKQQGVETVAATSHFYAMHDSPENFLQRRAQAVAQLEYDPADAPNVILGAEVAYFDGMSSSGVLDRLQLGDSGLVLVEMPFGAWSQRMIRELCQLPVMMGLTPVLAHVDRYRRADQFSRYRAELLDHGVLFQCNADAFLPRWDRRWALGMLKKGQIHFLGSDTHNLTSRAPKLDQAAKVITQKLGAHTLTELTAFSKEMLKL